MLDVAVGDSMAILMPVTCSNGVAVMNSCIWPDFQNETIVGNGG